VSTVTERPDLDARYGRSGRTRIRRRTIAIIAGAGVAVVLVAWLLWAGLLSPEGDLEATDVGHSISDDGRYVDIRYQLTIAPGTEARCALQAMNEGFTTVGWKTVTVPASVERVRVLHERVYTTELAVTGLIYRCWPA
jgi:hypothetical protein